MSLFFWLRDGLLFSPVKKGVLFMYQYDVATVA